MFAKICFGVLSLFVLFGSFSTISALTSQQIAGVVELLIQDKTDQEAAAYLEKISNALRFAVTKTEDPEKKQMLTSLMLAINNKRDEFVDEVSVDKIFTQIQSDIQSEAEMKKQIENYTANFGKIVEKSEYGLTNFFELIIQASDVLQTGYYDHVAYKKLFTKAYNDAYRGLKLSIDELKKQPGYMNDIKYRNDVVWYYSEFFTLLTTDYKYMSDTLSMNPTTWTNARIEKIQTISQFVTTRLDELEQQQYRSTKQFYERHGVAFDE